MAMTYADQADIQIEQLERDLAELQTESAYRQIDAALGRQRLKDTLQIAVAVVDRISLGMEVLDRIGDSFEESVERMQRDLAGRD
jgi:hypothetical protein